jgi:hypothetical protein
MSQSLQEFQFVSGVEAQDLIEVICRAMHGPDTEFSAFAPMPQHIVFEKLIGLKPHELLFMKTSAAINQKQADGNKIRVKVQGPVMDGNVFEKWCEKRGGTLADVFNGVDVINCVISGVDLQYYSLAIGNLKWMMAMHESSASAPLPPQSQRLFLEVARVPGSKAVLGSQLTLKQPAVGVTGALVAGAVVPPSATDWQQRMREKLASDTMKRELPPLPSFQTALPVLPSLPSLASAKPKPPPAVFKPRVAPPSPVYPCAPPALASPPRCYKLALSLMLFPATFAAPHFVS